MKFLVDENLPPRLALWLSDRGHDAIHVEAISLKQTNDASVAAVAVSEGRVIVTKDGDFDHLDVAVLRLSCGNCSNTALVAWLEERLDAAVARLADARQVLVED